MDRNRLRNQLIADEDNIPHAYQDSEGYWTIGVGHLVDERKGAGLDPDVIEHQLENDIDKVEMQVLHAFPWYQDLNDVRQEIILNMVFNLGLAGFKGFRKMINAVARHDFKAAQREMIDSKWYLQIKTRGPRLANAFLTGEW